MSRFEYSKFDERTWGPPFDVGELFDALSEDLFYHGDIDAALRRLLKEGFRLGNKDLPGLREIRRRILEQQEALKQRVDPNSLFSRYSERLESLLNEERRAIAALREAAEASGDERRIEITRRSMADKEMHLQLLPEDIAGKLASLASYEFVSPVAHEEYQRLVEELRKEILESFLKDFSRAVESMRPEDLARIREALAALNDLIERQQRGEDISQAFKDFMQKYGDMFPGNPSSLEELLREMAQHMAATSALLASMSDEQRAMFEQIAGRLLNDAGLQMELQRLASALRSFMPDLPWDEPLDFTGHLPTSFLEAQAVAAQLERLAQLEQILQNAQSPADLAELDLTGLEKLLGPDAVESLSQLRSLVAWLKEAGLIEQRGQRLQLTPRGMRRIGQKALDEVFSRLRMDKQGRHELLVTGVGGEPAYSTREYRFGDPFDLDLVRTLKNALSRQGPGTPVSLSPDDFEVVEREAATRSATVLMLDLSLSMPMRDNFLAAKKVALALYSLITTRYPKDYLGLIGFSEVAHEISPRDLPSVSWDFVYGTNIAHGLALARKMLERQHGTKQVILITDGEPTAHIDEYGQPFFSYPPTLATIRATLKEALKCTRAGITINTFLLGSSEYLGDFVRRMTAINGGRAFYTSPDNLGEFVFIDFLSRKTGFIRAS